MIEDFFNIMKKYSNLVSFNNYEQYVYIQESTFIISDILEAKLKEYSYH